MQEIYNEIRMQDWFKAVDFENVRTNEWCRECQIAISEYMETHTDEELFSFDGFDFVINIMTFVNAFQISFILAYEVWRKTHPKEFKELYEKMQQYVGLSVTEMWADEMLLNLTNALRVKFLSMYEFVDNRICRRRIKPCANNDSNE